MSAPDGSPVGAERSIGQLFASATTEMSALVHDEIALAKAQLKQDVKRGAVSGGAFSAAGAVLIFSLPMLNFALAYGIRTWSHWNLAICFVLSFAANVLVMRLPRVDRPGLREEGEKGQGPAEGRRLGQGDRGCAPERQTPPRTAPVSDAVEVVARSTS